MFGNLGLPELIIMAVIVALVVWPAWRICSKAGYSGVNSGLMSVGLLVPFVNLAIWMYLAFVEWPVERELKQFKAGRTE